MKIGIINAGNIGRTLAHAWYESEHELLLAKAGEQDKLLQFADEHNGVLTGNALEAAKYGDISLFSVYWPNLQATLQEGGEMEGQIVIDTMNPLLVNERFEHYHDTELMRDSSTSEVLQSKLPKAHVVKAFSSLPSQALDATIWRNNNVKPPIFIAGDNDAAKDTVKQLIRDAKFEAMDVGELKNARSIEQLGILLHHVAMNQFNGRYENLGPAFLQAEG